MTIKLGSLAANLVAEREGDWIEPKEWPGLNPDKPFEQVPLPGLAFLTRSTNYPPYATAYQAELEKLRQAYPSGTIPAEVQAKAEGQLAVEHLLLGWRGLDVTYSPDIVGSILTAEEHRVVRAMVRWCAGIVGKRKVEFEETASGN
ncbi:hypothetical protein X739_00505 [Mesorhizobium sp. LNHC220B00]|uniref:hypothetical protein n=1 Tax=Mesorhizobium sp. LNHC229A00 TaxID=1287240 RepID=UPI0003CEA528|nr:MULTISPECIES: hypothetical protein [unclassified Mesorhizobium]ESY75161.1 hypothetical protein X741_34740 [Mesorhizobium sp. LNHC229A00]ESY89020.1 hypothetical protein X739_00505 [Mesorhizobium sp. LNHC220B00]